MTAQVASGWSRQRVGFSPPGKRRLFTVHVDFGHLRTGDSRHLALRAIESPVLNRFRYLGIRDAFQTRKILNRARDLENSMIPAR